MEHAYFPPWRDILDDAGVNDQSANFFISVLMQDVNVIYIPSDDIQVVFVDELVDVGLDRTAMDEAFELVAAGEQDAPCPICIEPVGKAEPVYDIGCGHVFHTECLLQWVKRNATCPCCRKNLSC